ncbi:hypothetical protein [Winogradskya humida]|uniref:Uncharacterized protein n=1 Tax=Winogradskya humida TaxID=113566 RepID=A0ABQ4A771_9ACTN|nr:hypothetical protein [Actinoplanes humidus]GIE26167.1 hypothetical protein Ahu01nite_092690 [Actinoplanes humidus]
MTTWFTAADCSLDDFRAICEQKTDLADYPHATEVADGVLIYPGTVPYTLELRAELVRAIMDGPGVVVFTGASRPPSWTGPPPCSPS